MKKTSLLIVFAMGSSPSMASVHHHHHHGHKKAVGTSAAIGGAIGFAVGSTPGAAAGAAAGAALGAALGDAVSHTHHGYVGYKYYRGYYYDGKGRRFTAEEMKTRSHPADAKNKPKAMAHNRPQKADNRAQWSERYPGYIYWEGFYYKDGQRYSPADMEGANAKAH